VDVPKNDSSNVDANNHHESNLNSASDTLLSWKDILPLSLYTAMCLSGAILISTYEDYDVTHTRPSPSTLRLPSTLISSSTAESSSPSTTPSSTFSYWRNHFNFVGAATRGMGWGPSDRVTLERNHHEQGGSSVSDSNTFFEEWYGTSAATLQWKPGYNEIMLQHRSERVPRWNELDNEDNYAQSSSIAAKNGMVTTPSTTSKEQLQQAVLQLYHSLDELNELKLMSDDYMWDEMKERLNPTTTALVNGNSATAETTNDRYSLLTALEYSMDILKSAPSDYTSSTAAPSKYDSSSMISNQHNSPNRNNVKELRDLIGFDWGSCAWRMCGAKADAQEAIAELYSDVGMLEPFECRFVIDIVERSIRDVLAVVPDDLRPYENGAPMQARPYEAYVPQAGNDDEETGIVRSLIDDEYTQALAEMRVDFSME